MTLDEYREIMASRGRQPAAIADAPAGGVVVALEPQDKLNKTERAYRRMLELRLRAGEIRGFHVQAVTLVLGKDCRYTPDFLIIEQDHTLTFVEVKGFLRDDALVKFRAAQSQYPWARFVMVQRCKGEWKTIRA
jgi:hypothetical protein